MLHRTGNKYKTTRDGLIGILTTFQLSKIDYCMLTTLADSNDWDYRSFSGNRYVDPIQVKDPCNVSEEEMNRIAPGGYELYPSKVFV